MIMVYDARMLSGGHGPCKKLMALIFYVKNEKPKWLIIRGACAKLMRPKREEYAVNIVVLIKQVPESDALIQVQADGSGVEIEDRYCLNFFDSLAVEEALRIKERLGSGTVTCITLGTQKSIEVLRTAIAMGADEAILVADPALAGGDEYATAKALAAALKKLDYDLIICGREAFDDSSGIVGPLVAEFLGIPHITSVVKIDISTEKEAVIVERQEIIKTPLPVLLAAQKGLNEPRVPPVMGVMRATRAEIKKLDLAALGLSQAEVGRAGSREEIVRYHRPSSRPPVTMMQGAAADAVKQLVQCLREAAKVI
jgi:electron transfer flavoprotein beta subunit